MQSLNKLIERQAPRQMPLNSTCIQLYFRDHAEQNRTKLLFQNRSRTTRRWYYMRKSRNIRIFAWQDSKKNILAVDVHVLGSQNATACMQQP